MQEFVAPEKPLVWTLIACVGNALRASVAVELARKSPGVTSSPLIVQVTTTFSVDPAKLEPTTSNE